MPLEVEYIEVKAHKKVFAHLPTENVYVGLRKSKSDVYDDGSFGHESSDRECLQSQMWRYSYGRTENGRSPDVCGTMMVPIGHEPIRTELRYTEPKLEIVLIIANV